MDLKKKVAAALSQALQDAYVRLEDEHGISGFVVSPQFQGASALDRQEQIDTALAQAPEPLTAAERRRVLMIAGLTPLEFDAVGTRIRVQKIKELAGGAVEVVVHGRHSDAEYVRSALNNEKGVRTTEAKRVSGAPGILMYFRAKGTMADPLTRDRIIKTLKRDAYIEVVPKA